MLTVTFKPLGMTKSISCCYECLVTHIQKINITPQFNIDILPIQYWELLLAYPGVTDHIHMNGLNQVNAFLYAELHAKNNFIPQLILELKMSYYFASFLKYPDVSDHTQLK